jgi:DNA-directed RNA polymerase subunit RPC12/RpoP
LRDLCWGYETETHVIVAAAKLGIPENLLASASNNSVELHIPRLKKRLMEQMALTVDAADWAVESWAFALGIDLGKAKNVSENQGLTNPKVATTPSVVKDISNARKDEIAKNNSVSSQIILTPAKEIHGSSASATVMTHPKDLTNLKGIYINCPYCSHSVYTEKNGKNKCEKCRKKYTIKQVEKKLAGMYIECPFCSNGYYTEKNGKVKCAKCSKKVTVNQKERRLAGLHINCPYCSKGFYTEKNGKIECERCVKTIVVNQKERRLDGLFINCPYCSEDFYTVKNGKIKCEGCGKKITVNQSEKRLDGKFIICPYCSDSFYSEKKGKFKCEKCKKKFTILQNS